MKICILWKLILFALFLAMITSAPRAIADDINPDADVPDISTTDASPANPVLEIPQQCDQDSVAVLCDRSAEDTSAVPDETAAAPNANADDANAVANNPDIGSVYDYANQNITNEASAMGTMSVPLGLYAPAGYPVLSPAPTIVSSGAVGPGSYQQWAGGPGSYQQWSRGPGTYRSIAPGPGYIAPMPLGFHPSGLGGGFGMHSFRSFAGAHFGRR